MRTELNFVEKDGFFKAGMQDSVVIHGATFTPHVSENGTLSWTNDGCLPNPEPVSLVVDLEWDSIKNKPAIGVGTGENAIVEGEAKGATGKNSYAQGLGTLAVGWHSHAEGLNTQSNGNCSHAEGNGAYANGSSSHAEGEATRANGNDSHAEGYRTTAEGIAAHSEGERTAANGRASHAEGYYTIAGSDYQHVDGKFNVEDAVGKYARITGGGTSDTARKNIHTLDWGGTAWFAGNLYTGGTNQNDKNAKRLATEEFVTNAIKTAIEKFVNVSEVGQ